MFPDVQFTLVDAIEKKVRAVNVIYRALALQNVTAEQQRAEAMKGGFDFVVSRAVTSFLTLYDWSARMVLKRELNPLPNGIITLKGGDLAMELAPFVNDVYQFALTDYFQEQHFVDKYLVYLPVY